ncbi:response regulator [Ramlibacter sp. MMS24-I3-19]|uniref:response regulator n=1 Tax=Ramlibacter sp. MMS24-I3-19 TaxID=3416606 RepID=UPI003CFF67D1
MDRRILVVEDLRAAQHMVSELLALVGGYQVVGVCRTEGSALQWLHEHPHGADLVVLDLMLQEGSGFSVLRKLDAPHTPDVVVFSDFATPAVADKCRELGAKAAISKSDVLQLRDFLEGFGNDRAQAA